MGHWGLGSNHSVRALTRRSDSGKLSSGAIHGSVIGPLLFVLYNNDIVDPFAGGVVTELMLMTYCFTVLSILSLIANNYSLALITDLNGQRHGN